MMNTMIATSAIVDPLSRRDATSRPVGMFTTDSGSLMGSSAPSMIPVRPAPTTEAQLNPGEVIWWWDSQKGGLQPENVSVQGSPYGCPITNSQTGTDNNANVVFQYITSSVPAPS